MTTIEALLLALALCVDSLVVSATTSFRSRISYGRGLVMALIFGFCQGLFPLLGALIGDVARTFIEAVDHWVSFALLAFVGGRMVAEGISSKEDAPKKQTVNVGTMFLLGVATSIDAFAVGIGLGLQQTLQTIAWVVAMIAAVTFLVSMLGVWLGRRGVPVPERTANFVAGLVLIALGTKILVEHIFF